MTKPRLPIERHLAPPPGDATLEQRQLVAHELALHAAALREQAARQLTELSQDWHYEQAAAVRDALMIAADRLAARAEQWLNHGNEV